MHTRHEQERDIKIKTNRLRHNSNSTHFNTYTHTKNICMIIDNFRHEGDGDNKNNDR